MPDLDFVVEGAEAPEFAATPALLFRLRIDNRTGEPIRSILLNVQLRIAANQRFYAAEEQARLRELFGEPSRWAQTLNSMLWCQTVVQAPPFSEATTVDLLIPCTYDFEVASAKYFHALEDGEIPLEFLFSGSVFYAGATGLQVEQISWEKEAQYRLPVSLWRQMMDRYFPNSAWLRLHRDVFDQLYAYRTRAGLPTWEATLERLLAERSEGVAP